MFLIYNGINKKFSMEGRTIFFKGLVENLNFNFKKIYRFLFYGAKFGGSEFLTWFVVYVICIALMQEKGKGCGLEN